ncbi:DUF1573 domain-containing protein [Roseivirga echinicomitans]
MTKLSSLLVLIFLPALLWCQSPEIVEVGAIDGEINNFHGKFQWENISMDTVHIGFWSGDERLKVGEESIKAFPKQIVSIPFTIATEGYVGGFKIGLRILSQSEIILKEYSVEGRILEPVKDVFKAYRNIFWPFRSKFQLVNFKAGFIGDDLNAEMMLYNFGGKQVNLSQASISDYYDVSFEPMEIAHNSFTKMSIVLKTDSLLNPGFTNETVQVKDRNDSLIFSIPVQFTLENKPSEVSSDSPYLTVSSLNHDFKVLQTNDKRSVKITLSNAGRELLELYKIESNCSCLEYSIDKASLTSGESVEMEVTFNATNRLGFERKTLAIFSNDPRKPTVVITFLAHVK